MAILTEIRRIKETFSDNLKSVDELINFDKIVLNIAISHLDELTKKLKFHHRLDNPHLSVDKTLQMLKNIREHKSLEINYKRVFNQCLVLLVSYFSTTVRELFQTAIDEALALNNFDNINKTQLSLTLFDLQNDVEKTRSIGDLLATQKDISFQDLQSIARTFQEYFSIQIEKNQNTNNIILAQACRHAIVHSGSKVDRKLLNQVSKAVPRTIKQEIELGSEILFNQEEISIISESMQQYLDDLFSNVKNKLVVA
jgi:hypothetical protein